MSQIWTQSDFDALDPAEVADGILILPQCHPSSELRVFYEKDKGQLVLLCPQCRKEVARVEVAP